MAATGPVLGAHQRTDSCEVSILLGGAPRGLSSPPPSLTFKSAGLSPFLIISLFFPATSPSTFWSESGLG